MSITPAAARRQCTGAVLPRTNGVLPVICNDPTDAQRWRDQHSYGMPLSGEIRLAWAILEMALDELDKPPSYTDRHRDPRIDARNYVASTERGYVFSFSRVCELFGMNPSLARHRLLDHLEPLPPPRLSATEKRAAKNAAIKAKVFAAMRAGIEMPGAMAAATGLARSTVTNVLARGIRDGEVERVGLARYRIRGGDAPVAALEPR